MFADRINFFLGNFPQIQKMQDNILKNAVSEKYGWRLSF